MTYDITVTAESVQAALSGQTESARILTDDDLKQVTPYSQTWDLSANDWNVTYYDLTGTWNGNDGSTMTLTTVSGTRWFGKSATANDRRLIFGLHAAHDPILSIVYGQYVPASDQITWSNGITSTRVTTPPSPVSSQVATSISRVTPSRAGLLWKYERNFSNVLPTGVGVPKNYWRLLR